MNQNVLKFALVGLLVVAFNGGCLAEKSSETLAGKTSVRGKVVFEGDAPKRKRIRVSADPACKELHADEPLRSESVLVNDNGTLRNVFVYVKKGLEGKTFDTPTEPVILSQQGCQYRPHVLGMQAKQMLKIKNADPTTHNVHALPKRNRQFNKGQPEGGADLETTFPRKEVMVAVKCDVHPWMIAYIGVLPHPYFSVTGEDGTFAIEGLPAGDYEIGAWHEKYGTQTRTVTVGDGETKEITFTFKAE